LKNGSRSGRLQGLEIGFSNGRRPNGLAQHETTTPGVLRLQQSRVALAGLTQALAVSERHSGVVHKQLEALAEINAYLRGRLVEAERKVVMASHLAYHDALTGLPNRRLLLDRLSQAIARPSRHGRRVALVFFDVYGFKAINDRLGHTSGDKVLQEIAQRLSACLRATDTACRYGGDEFIVMLPEVEGKQGAAVVEQKIRSRLAAPYRIDGAMIVVTLSMGVAAYPEDAKDCHDLIKLADAAMSSMRTEDDAKPNVQKSTGSASRVSVE
jgi:diguanylate cyclase (GGDEF)-like protein